ncbi:histone-lysine N-methyltransferase set-1-like [Melanotaenia boesemani]|uniref:histone-lysine N-methyltransferase set-1-like n=1 Tax=Melanotaenia boesemani TaxID=1250792 RepID=UPI001C03DE6F|nr:histone-lysine N-methyltransferase set-1-like [Melanotaenia boesemani]
MAARRRRKAPVKDAIEHAVKGLDKTTQLEVKYINSFKGRGVFSRTIFQKGDFVAEYRGELINGEEAEKRRKHNRACAVFMYDFPWRERTWCIDAAQEDGSYGRLINDDYCHPNCKMKKVVIQDKPHLFLFALQDINPGEEVTYDYGGSDWPWRKQQPSAPVADQQQVQYTPDHLEKTSAPAAIQQQRLCTPDHLEKTSAPAAIQQQRLCTPDHLEKVCLYTHTFAWYT